LLCIGLNPSHKESFYIKQNINLNSFNTSCFSLNQNSNINQLIKDQYNKGIQEYKTYYSKIDEVSEYIGLDKEHIDIFTFRDSCSSCLELFNKKNHSLADQQKKITKQIIQDLSPSIIFVGNASASRIFENVLFQGKCIYLEKLGYHITKINKRIIPTFFSGQISGGATDNYSFLRLKYLMKKANEEKRDLNNIS
jgi:hypothetical protein